MTDVSAIQAKYIEYMPSLYCTSASYLALKTKKNGACQTETGT